LKLKGGIIMTARTIAIKRNITVKTQALATLAAVAATLVLPQLLHAAGVVSGTGNALGQSFLPMYLPILLVGLLAGPVAGAVSGALAPLISFAISGMPPAAMLPFITAELILIGFAAGMLRDVKMPTIGKVALAQLAGKAMYALAILTAVYAFGNETVGIGNVLGSIGTGLPGLALQWVLLPLIVFWVENRKKHES
jgi:hypothetical protein